MTITTVVLQSLFHPTNFTFYIYLKEVIFISTVELSISAKTLAVVFYQTSNQLNILLIGKFYLNTASFQVLNVIN